MTIIIKDTIEGMRVTSSSYKKVMRNVYWVTKKNPSQAWPDNFGRFVWFPGLGFPLLDSVNKVIWESYVHENVSTVVLQKLFNIQTGKSLDSVTNMQTYLNAVLSLLWNTGYET